LRARRSEATTSHPGTQRAARPRCRPPPSRRRPARAPRAPPGAGSATSRGSVLRRRDLVGVVVGPRFSGRSAPRRRRGPSPEHARARARRRRRPSRASGDTCQARSTRRPRRDGERSR
jgi:hypothetical protein